MIEEGNKVAVVLTHRGVHKGDLPGIQQPEIKYRFPAC